MKTLKTLALLAALALGIATPAGAGLYSITFNEENANVGSGEIDVELAINNYYAASGFLAVTAGQALGDWNLYIAGGTTSYPGFISSPRGAFLYNNAVYPTGQNPQYPDTNPLLDVYGLLFTQNNDNELNLWGNADGTYTLGSNMGGQTVTVTISFGGTTITPVPEPVGTGLMAVGVLGVCVTARHLRGRFGRRPVRAATIQ